MSPLRATVRSEAFGSKRGLRTTIGQIGLIGIIYVVAGKLGLALAIAHESTTAVWPNTGIALAALLVFGRRVWPGVFAGAFLVNVAPSASVTTALGIALGNTLEAILAMALVNRYARGRNAFQEVADVLRFVLFAGILAPLVSATIGVASLLAGGAAAPAQAGAIWLTWWLGDGVGALLVGPPLILLGQKPRFRFDKARAAEALGLVAALIAIAAALIEQGFPTPLEFLCVPLLVWAVVRFEALVSSAVMLAISAASIWGTVHAAPERIVGRENDVLLLLQGWNGVMALVTLSLAAAMADRRRARMRYEFLAASARALARSDDVEVALREVAALSIPRIADRAAIFLAQDDGAIRVVAEALEDQDASPSGSIESHGASHWAPQGLQRAIRTGESAIEQNSMIVPLRARRRVLGALALGSARDDTHYGPVDIRLAEDLAAQIVLAMDSARRYRKWEHRAYHDALTTLPNRALFLERLGWALDHARRKRDYGFAVLFFDLDGFKPINDQMGHHVGDELLVAVAERLAATLQRGGDVVARIGGDEFAILLDDIAEVRQAIRVATRIQRALAQPFRLNGHQIQTAAAIGIAMSSTAYGSGEEIVRDADAAMYKAKRRGRGQIEVFDRVLRAEGLSLLELGTELLRAGQQDELAMHYQPVASLSTGRLTAAHAQTFWRHPRRGLIGPRELARIADESDLTELIGTWALATACRQAEAWHRSSLLHVPVTIHIPSRLFRREDLPLMMLQVVIDSGLPPALIEIEITDHFLAGDVDAAVTIMRELKHLGLRLAMDDFGTSVSSLGNLRRFPIDTVKIDGSLVESAAAQPRDAAVTRAVIRIAHDMGLWVVADGVESLGQFNFLGESRCDAYQGGHLSVPLVPAHMEALLDAKESAVESPRAPTGTPCTV